MSGRYFTMALLMMLLCIGVSCEKPLEAATQEILNEDSKDNPEEEPEVDPEDDPEDKPEDDPEDNPGDAPEDEPGDDPEDNPEDDPEDTPGDDPEDNPGDTPGEDTPGQGTETSPYTASEAISFIQTLEADVVTDEEYYVSGTISGIKSYSSRYHSITYFISDDGSTNNQLQIYSGKGLNGADFNSMEDLSIGEKVVVKGPFCNYRGNTPEVHYDNQIVSIERITKATATVNTEAATNIQGTQATLNGSFYGATGTIYEVGFYYGTSSSVLNETVTTDGTNETSGSFSCEITGLQESTVYYYRAYVMEYNEHTARFEERLGMVYSFSTDGTNVSMPADYLSCYEVPDVSGILSGSGVTGRNDYRDDSWSRYYTNNSQRQIAVHTYTHPSLNRKVRNYTVLFDGSKYAPLWCAKAVHRSMWPNNGVGRANDWQEDPAITLTQQGGLNNAGSVGYSRGHLVPSNGRQTTYEQNAQTFYYTNQAPQWQDSFNSGVWSDLEYDIDSNAPSGADTVYVVTGVLYEVATKTLPSGSLNVPIPSHFYKCIMHCSFSSSGTMSSAKGIAYIFTNEEHYGVSYNDSKYRTTIKAIEERTGFNFFPNVPTQLQESAESNSSPIW